MTRECHVRLWEGLAVKLRRSTQPYVATWSGLVFVAFVIDVFARRIVGWRVSRSMKAELVLDVLEQALWAQGNADGLIHYSDRDSQYLAIRYTERLAEADIQCSVGSTGDSYDNALAESIAPSIRSPDAFFAKNWRIGVLWSISIS